MISLSLCMIVKNEETNIESCLKSISSYIDEIIIVDTGSEDRTKELAMKYTDKVYNFEWNNNFADARNFSLSKSSNDYVLVLDCDEIVQDINIIEIKKLIEENPDKIGRLLIVNEFKRKGVPYKSKERLSRLFSKKHYAYNGMIHEQIVPIFDKEISTYDVPLKIIHNGYTGDVEARKFKTDRNINLLKTALKETPDDPYIIYQLGKSYYMEEEYLGACKYFERALYYDLDTRLEYVQDMVESYGYSLLNSAQYDVALQLLNVYEDFSHSADFIFLVALILMNNGEFQEAVNEFIKATEKKECKMEGVNDYLAYYNIGVIFECLGDNETSRKYYEKCGKYKVLKNA
ncbi:hypothetical protein acsn021_05170 [Anaerocolumna cellulosilytica]|uniref:Uncharacterized protein n=1 Tax=Anaerocolumna cellulosilytica TaxID=433286 RepID=A0A6S6R1R9_9FIRM|nr:glycosyltransferase family 2 protein [Anaerocolumna cellulosilytica]MBB5195716.1 hypothetical protein [Anaerocolumna cellulosilytica]BCJ92948.1 hypothetical protein acsn021_05170 [Anaerocolumna cellulosilytica]